MKPCFAVVAWILILRSVSVFAQSATPELPPPTYANVKYGQYNRNLLDFWKAKSETPAPLLISIHGGGFIAGNKTVPKDLLEDCLKSGISVAAINYRYSSQAIAPAPFLDCARALQFLRTKAKDWNVDPKRIASSGESAGAGMSLWMGFHEDLADPRNPDPVLRESTRLTCVVTFEGQSSYDLRFIRDLFPGRDIYRVMPLPKLFDVNPDRLDDLPLEKYKLFEECSAINHLTKDDPPVLMWYANPMDVEITTQRIGIHHPILGQVLKMKMDALSIPCEVVAAGKQLNGDPPTPTIDFLRTQFRMSNPSEKSKSEAGR